MVDEDSVLVSRALSVSVVGEAAQGLTSAAVVDTCNGSLKIEHEEL